MSAHLYREAFATTIKSSFEPGRPNKYQTWAVKFTQDPNPFYLPVNGVKIEVNRARVVAKALELGKEYMNTHSTNKLPVGFFRTEVLPAVISDLGG